MKNNKYKYKKVFFSPPYFSHTLHVFQIYLVPIICVYLFRIIKLKKRLDYK